jgi:hypothetical protein
VPQDPLVTRSLCDLANRTVNVVIQTTLVGGVRGKDALWTALQRAGISLEDVDLDALGESARAQGAELEALRLTAVARAFARASGEISAGQAAA